MNAISKIKYPVAIEWPISEHRLKELKDIPGAVLCSDTFIACEDLYIGYYASICSYEPGHERHGEIDISLFLDDLPDETKAEAKFNIKVESAGSFVEINHIYDSDDEGWGRRLCTTDELFDPERRFVVNGELRIAIDGFLLIKKEENSESWTCGKKDDSLGIGLWEQEGHKDFIIEVGGKKITVHKNVLAARSTVFARMFQSGMKEAQEGKVIIEDFPFDTVEKGIKLCYHYSLVTGSSMEDKIKLLQFLDKYDMQSLKDDLEDYLLAVIDQSNVCLLTNCSLLSNALKLKRECYNFLQDYLHERKPIADFDLLDKDFAMYLLKNAFSHLSM